jgi:hypothetical protein
MGRTAQRVILSLSSACLGAILVAGCSTGERAGRQTEGSSPNTDIRKFEKDFTPSDYGPDAAAHRAKAPDTTGGSGEGGNGETAPFAAEMVLGFRVQVYSTSNIDDAKGKKEEAESSFPSEWFYLQYDPPAYKIRAGNFLTRIDAERFRGEAMDRGFRGAWIVPEKVFKQPPPPPPRSDPAQPHK